MLPLKITSWFVMLSSLTLASCMTRQNNTSGLAADASELPDEMLSGLVVTNQKLDSNSFSTYQIGEVSKDTGFPKAYIALPSLSDFLGNDSSIAIQGYINANGSKTGIVMVYANGIWTNGINKNALSRYEIGLLNYPNAKLDIEIQGNSFMNPVKWKTQTFDLSAGTVINPFIGMQIVKINPTDMKWVESLNDKNMKLLNLNFIVQDSGSTAFQSSITPKRDGTSFTKPESVMLALTNQDVLNMKTIVNATYGDATGKIQRGKKEFSSLSQMIK